MIKGSSDQILFLTSMSERGGSEIEPFLSFSVIDFKYKMACVPLKMVNMTGISKAPLDSVGQIGSKNIVLKFIM